MIFPRKKTLRNKIKNKTKAPDFYSKEITPYGRPTFHAAQCDNMMQRRTHWIRCRGQCLKVKVSHGACWNCGVLLLLLLIFLKSTFGHLGKTESTNSCMQNAILTLLEMLSCQNNIESKLSIFKNWFPKIGNDMAFNRITWETAFNLPFATIKLKAKNKTWWKMQLQKF